MRPAKEITAEKENLRIDSTSYCFNMLKRDPVEPEPKGTIILMAFRIDDYIQDCDGSLMASLTHLSKNLEETGWCPDRLRIYPDTCLVVDKDELKELFKKK